MLALDETCAMVVQVRCAAAAMTCVFDVQQNKRLITRMQQS
jgi:hypothetical protein